MWWNHNQLNKQCQQIQAQLIIQDAAIIKVQATVDEIKKILESSHAVKLAVSYKEDSMDTKPKGKLKAGVDFILHDDGTATATLTPVDAAGVQTTMPTGASVPAWTSNNPAIVVTAAADGMSAKLAPANPPVLATGVIISASSTLADGTAISGQGDPIDVTGGAAAGFKIVEQ